MSEIEIERESRYRAIFESAVDFAIIATDREGLVTDWNSGAESILGWSAEDMCGSPASRFFTPEDCALGIAEREMATALANGRASDERWHLRADGSRFWANGEMMPLRGAEGAHLGFLKILRDRTGQREAIESQRADAEFLRSVLASSADCIKVLDLDANLTFMTEGSMKLMEVSDFNAISGCPWPDFWENEGNAAARAAVATAKAGGRGHFQGPANTMKGTPKWWDVQVTPILGADGRPEKILAVSRDITETREAEQALRSAESFNALVLEASHDCIVILDLSAKFEFVSPGGMSSMEVDDVNLVIGRSWVGVWNGGDRDSALAAIQAAREGRVGHFQGFCPTMKGTPKWWDVVVSPILGADGTPQRLVSIGRDITTVKQAEEQQSLLMEELNHRIKNTFAIVMAISSQSLRGEGSLADAREAFIARLLVLSKAHDVLMQGSWSAASLRLMVEDAVNVHGGTRRFRIDGPDVMLGPKAALSFALVLHELGTNAQKYGALSVPDGHVSVTWALDETGGAPGLHFRWQEAGGPAVTAPEKPGFGSRLIERSFPSGTAVKLAYPPDGVTLTLRASLTALQDG